MQTAGGLSLHLRPSKNRLKYKTVETVYSSDSKAPSRKKKRKTR
jgi:hypothetical protein